MQVHCSCGSEIEVPYDFVGELTQCPDCQRSLRVIASAQPTGLVSGTGRLIISEGPDRVGEQLILTGDDPIQIGKVPSNAIFLPAEHVSRHHCRLVRETDHWRVEDMNSSAGLFVNGTRTAGEDLKTGDVLQIGEYELEYEADESANRLIEPDDAPSDLYDLAPAGRTPHTRAAMQTFTTPPPSQIAGAVPCPSCGRSYPFGTKICVNCGIDIRTGRPLLTAREVDENSLYVHTETAVRAISFVIPFGLYPVASEGFGSRKPYVIWGITIATIVISVMFWITNMGGNQARGADDNLMLWAGRSPTESDIFRGYKTTGRGDSDAFLAKAYELDGKVPDDQLTVRAYQDLSPDQKCYGDFHFWQLVTHAFLHGGIMHLAGNMLFLLVLGTRVNALIGQWKTALVYPILAIAAALAYMIAERNGPPAAMLGASGAIMGLAGMYIVLFPVHRVHMVIWLRLGLFRGLMHNIFAVRGFWVVLFYIAFDVAATLLGSKDGVAHWAHLGGFISGALIALLLLMTRQVDARGADLISVTMGRRAWALLGKPGNRA
jgi:membrane associated rhomboid family serine protease